MKPLCTLLACALAASALPVHAADSEPFVEEIVVIGQRAMLRSSIARQKDSDRIESVLTRDAIGQFPDQNVAESMRRLTGVNVLNDQGEGRFIAIRGLDPSLNSASINGTRLPSPESDTRSVALDVVPSELVESLQVIKTLTPDMDADTIGAAIQINTTNALDAEAFFNAKIEQSYNDLSEEYSPKASIDFMVPISGRLGISGGISYSQREFSTDNIESEGWDITDDGILYADTVEYRDYDVLRERTGVSLSMDYQATDNTRLFARVIYSAFDDTEERKRLTIELDKEPSFGTSSSATFLSDDGEIALERDIKDRFEAQEIESYQFGGESLSGEWTIGYSLSYSRAEEHEHETQDPTRFEAAFEDPGQLQIAFDYSDMGLPAYLVTTGLNEFLDPKSYVFDKLEEVDGLAEDEEWAAQVDLSRDFDLERGVLQLKFGAKVRQRTKAFDLFLEVFDEFDGDYTLGDVIGGQSYGLASIDPLPGLEEVRQFYEANRDRFETNVLDTAFESAISDFVVDEDIAAAYLMARWENGPLMIVGGVRVEHTENNVAANLVELVEEGATRDGIVLVDDTLFVTPNEFEKSYTDWMPSLSMRYELGDDKLIRAGVFKSVVRPNIAQLAPRFVVEQNDEGEREGEFGNADLDPYVAWNFDLSVEWYLSSDAVVQAGYFYKQIDDFIVDVEFESGDALFNGVYNGISFSEALIPLNGDEATVYGVEFNYQQALTQLPGPFDGVLVGINYTYTATEADVGERSIPLPAASKNNWNAMVGYEKGPLSLRLTASFRDEYLDEVGTSAEEDRYVDEHLQLDLSVSYWVTDHWKIYAQFVNLNDEPYLAYQSGPGSNRLLQYEEYSWTGKFGIQANF